MAEQRDPRRDPRPGDVLQRGNETRRVYGLPELRSYWITYNDAANSLRACRRGSWEAWARNATVLHTAPEE